MEQQVKENVSVDSTLQNHGINEFGIVDGQFKCFFERSSGIICSELASYLDYLEYIGDSDNLDFKVFSFCRACVSTYRKEADDVC